MATTCSACNRLATPQAGVASADFFGRLLDTADFPARWHCGRWSAGLGWLHIGSDLAIAAAYLSIPLTLAYFLARRRDLPFPGLLALVAAFILSCGLGHAVEALIFWHPVYRLAGVLKGVTAAISWATVVATVRVLPAALRLPDLARSERALRASEERFALAVRGTDHGIWDWDLAGGSVYYSPRFRELLGLGGDAIAETLDAWESRLHPEDRGRVMAAIADHLGRRAGFDVEYRLGTEDRGYAWFHARGQAIWDADGRPSRMAGSIADVTDRKRQEEVIAEQVRLAEFGRDIALALTEAATLPAMLGRCAEETVRHLDAAFARIWTLGESAEELELRASAGMYTHLDGPHARIQVGRAKIGRIARDRRPHLTNAVLGDPDVPAQDWAEREGMVAFAGYPLIVEGRLVGVWALFARRPLSPATLAAMESVASGIALGIERKRAGEALARSEAQARRLALVADRTDNAVIITDAAGRIEWVNDGFTRLTEYRLDEALGRKPGSFLQGPETDPGAVRQIRERLAAGEGFKAEGRQLREIRAHVLAGHRRPADPRRGRHPDELHRHRERGDRAAARRGGPAPGPRRAGSPRPRADRRAGRPGRGPPPGRGGLPRHLRERRRRDLPDHAGGPLPPGQPRAGADLRLRVPRRTGRRPGRPRPAALRRAGPSRGVPPPRGGSRHGHRVRVPGPPQGRRADLDPGGRPRRPRARRRRQPLRGDGRGHHRAAAGRRRDPRAQRPPGMPPGADRRPPPDRPGDRRRARPGGDPGGRPGPGPRTVGGRGGGRPPPQSGGRGASPDRRPGPRRGPPRRPPPGAGGGCRGRGDPGGPRHPDRRPGPLRRPPGAGAPRSGGAVRGVSGRAAGGQGAGPAASWRSTSGRR